MKKRLKMKITTVRQQTTGSALAALRFACPVCEREEEMLTGVQATEILGIDHPTLDRLIASGKVHSIQTVSGNIRVCKDSLFLKQEEQK